LTDFLDAGDPIDSPERISPRYGFDARIRIHLSRDDKKLALQGWARNLSESGLGAFVAEPLQLDEVVILEVPLPHAGDQIIPATVVRTLGTEYGFQFTALSAEQRRHIRTTLKGRPPIPYPGALG
jgi:PilZ domain